jgi:NAD(P) transhydrogenase
VLEHYDLCVIGSGPGGQKAAIQAAKLGKRVLVAERMEVVGGVATNTGTIPSKALREAVLALTRSGEPLGAPGRPSASGVTLKDLLDRCHRIIEKEIDIVRRHLNSNGVDLVQGAARFVDGHAVTVTGSRASASFTADRFVIAVGTVPARPEGIPFDGVRVLTSDDLLDLQRLPRSLIVVGGGVIGTEYASMFAQLGVRVTLVEGRPRLLEFVDAEVAEALQYHLRAAGMTLRLGETVVSISNAAAADASPRDDEPLVEATLESGKALRANALLYCVGRQGATDDLGLAAVGLAADPRGRLRVDDDFCTENQDIRAVGDVIGFPALASTSMDQGRVAVCRMYGAPVTSVPALFPYGIYSIPEISTVGRTEAQLTGAAVPYESGVARYAEIAKSQLLGDEVGMLKLLFHQKTREILGVHAIGTGATELIHIGQAVMAFGGTVDYFVDTVFNYPTLAECYKVAALNGLNKLSAI